MDTVTKDQHVCFVRTGHKLILSDVHHNPQAVYTFKCAMCGISWRTHMDSLTVAEKEIVLEYQKRTKRTEKL